MCTYIYTNICRVCIVCRQRQRSHQIIYVEPNSIIIYIEFGMVLLVDDRRENRQRKFQNERQTNRIFLRIRLNGVSNCVYIHSTVEMFRNMSLITLQ